MLHGMVWNSVGLADFEDWQLYFHHKVYLVYNGCVTNSAKINVGGLIGSPSLIAGCPINSTWINVCHPIHSTKITVAHPTGSTMLIAGRLANFHSD